MDKTDKLVWMLLVIISSGIIVSGGILGMISFKMVVIVVLLDILTIIFAIYIELVNALS